MPKPSVDPNTLVERTPKSLGNWDPRLASTEQGTDQDCGNLSYLKGAIGSGERDGMWDAPMSQYAAIQELRQHTVEPGFSTYFKSDFERGDKR